LRVVSTKFAIIGDGCHVTFWADESTRLRLESIFFQLLGLLFPILEVLPVSLANF